MNEKLREIERHANDTRAPEDFVKYAVALQRVGRENEGRGVLVDLFRQNPENSVIKSAWVSNFGLPWVEQNPPDAPDSVRWYNVMHKGVYDEARVPYVFTWDKELFRHPDRNQEINGRDYFSQERLASILAREGMQKRPPTASAVHSHVLALEEMLRLGVPSAQVQLARGFLRQHLAEWPLTWTQIDCDKPAVIQDYDRQEQRNDVDIRGVDGYLINWNVRENREGDLVKNVILHAEQSVEEIDRMYTSLLGVSNGAYALRPSNNATGKRAVVLGRDGFGSGFGIDCVSIYNDGPARLVVTQKAKDCYTRNNGGIE